MFSYSLVLHKRDSEFKADTHPGQVMYHLSLYDYALTVMQYLKI